MAATLLKQGLAVFLVASLAVVAPLAGAAQAPAGFQVERRAAEAAAVDICTTVFCQRGLVCQPAADGNGYACVRPKKCGDVFCPPGTRCCNPLRNICTRPGVVCPLGGPDEGSSATNIKKDVDSSSMAGEAVSVRDISSSEEEAAAPTTGEAYQGEARLFNCGPGHCKVGQECCNPSCGICTAPGKGCTKQFCSPGSGPKCGAHAFCPVGWVCCSPSCGICSPRGGACPQIVCKD